MTAELGARVIIFDNELSPSQIQELEKERGSLLSV